MHIEQRPTADLQAELTISLQPEDYNPAFEKKLKEYRKNLQLPGFRPGQVPVTLIRQRFGKSVLAEEINTILQNAIHQYIEEKKINVLGSPLPSHNDEVNGNWDNPGEFTFRYDLGLAPELKFELDKNLRFTYYKVDVDEALVNRQMKDLARRYGQMSEPETSGPEDLLVCTLHELDEAGNLKEGGINNKTSVSIGFIKDAAVKQSLTGLKKGDSVEVDPHALNEDHEDLARMLGITHHQVHHLHSHFQLTVEEIKHIEPHELNTELFDKLYGEGAVTSEEEMRQRVKADLERMFVSDSEWLFKREAAGVLIDTLNPQLPDEFLKRFIAATNEKPLSQEVIDYEYPLYARSIRWDLLKQHIIHTHQLQVNYEELKNHVKAGMTAQFARYGLPVEDDRLEEMAKKHLQEKEQLRETYDLLMENKVMDVLKTHCTIEEKRLPHAEFVHRVQHAG